MQQHQHGQPGISQPGLLILACLIDGPKTATELRQVTIQEAGKVIEPATFSREVARLERKGWIASSDGGERLSLYHITASGLLTLEREEAKHQQNQEAQECKKRGCGLFQRKEFAMRLVLRVLRLYPLAWRERYEMEMVALLEQHRITLWTMLDLLIGALDARLDPHYHRTQQLILLRRFQTSWRLVMGAFVAFWIALIPWLWMSVLGISSQDSTWSYCGDTYATCLFRVNVGRHTPGWPLDFVHWILILLPFLLIGFTITLVQAHNRRARVRLWLALPVTIAMVALNVACVLWYFSLWQFLPQVNLYFSLAPAGLLLGLIGMGLASALALVALSRAGLALRLLSSASTGQTFTPTPVQMNAQVEQITAESHHGPVIVRGVEKSSKLWKGLLAVLLLTFLLPWPSLFNTRAPSLRVSFFTWCFAAIVGGVTALLMRVCDNKSGQSVAGKRWSVISSSFWYVVFPLALFSLTFLSFLLLLYGSLLAIRLLVLACIGGGLLTVLTAVLGNRRDRRMSRQPSDKIAILVGVVLFFLMLIPLVQLNLIFWLRVVLGGLSSGSWTFILMPFLSGICILSALIVRVQTRNTLTGSMSPKVWIVILPVWLIAFCMDSAYLIGTDYNSLGNVLMAWLFTGLAGLIIVVTMKIGSRQSTSLSSREQEALQQTRLRS